MDKYLSFCVTMFMAYFLKFVLKRVIICPQNLSTVRKYILQRVGVAGQWNWIGMDYRCNPGSSFTYSTIIDTG